MQDAYVVEGDSLNLRKGDFEACDSSEATHQISLQLLVLKCWS